MNVDVIIPVYNGEAFVAEAIRSVLAQTYQPHRVIVVDDGSTDRTCDVIEKVMAESGPVVVYVFKKNGGPNSARNVGLQKVESDFVAFLDADDSWYPEKLARQLEVFAKSGDRLGLVYTSYQLMDAGSRILDVAPMPIDQHLRGNVFRRLLRGNRVMGSASAVLMKKSFLDAVGPFDETLRIGEDWDMWLRLAEVCDFDFVDLPLVNIRRHANNTQANEEYVFHEELKFYGKWLKRLPSGLVPHWHWASTIASRVLSRLPRRDFLDALVENLSPEGRRRMFRMTAGSIRVFLAYYALRLACWKIVRAVAGLFRTWWILTKPLNSK